MEEGPGIRYENSVMEFAEKQSVVRHSSGTETPQPSSRNELFNLERVEAPADSKESAWTCGNRRRDGFDETPRNWDVKASPSLLMQPPKPWAYMWSQPRSIVLGIARFTVD